MKQKTKSPYSFFGTIIAEFYTSMFKNRDAVIKGKKFPLKKAKGLRQFRVGNLLFIEQNPRKKSEWAEKARKGAKILWVIDTRKNRYLYRIVDGKLTKLI